MDPTDWTDYIPELGGERPIRAPAPLYSESPVGLPNLLLPPDEVLGNAVANVAPKPQSILPVAEALKKMGYRGLPRDVRLLQPYDAPQVLPDQPRPRANQQDERRYVPLFQRLPELGDIHQNQLGDCWFLSALAAIIYSWTGDAIRLLLCDRGSYALVRLWGQNRSPNWFRVDKRLLKMTSSGAVFHSTGGLWAAVLERAMTAIAVGKSDQRGVHVITPYEISPQDATYERLKGGGADLAFEALLGVETDTKPINDVPHHVAETSDAYATLRNLLSGNSDYRISLYEQAQVFGLLLPPGRGNFHSFYTSVWEPWAWQTDLQQEWRRHRQPFNNPDSPRVYRLEDFSTFLTGFAARPSSQAQWKSFVQNRGLYSHLTARQAVDCVCRWARQQQIFTGKRGTGRYTQAQEGLYQDIKARVAARLPQVLSTRATISNKPRDARSPERGSSGETQAKGLAGTHGYAVLECHTDADTGLRFVKVWNPWGHYGRGYRFAPEHLRLKMTPTAVRRAQERADNHLKIEQAYETETPFFWLELTDVTKRCDLLVYCKAIPAFIRQHFGYR